MHIQKIDRRKYLGRAALATAGWVALGAQPVRGIEPLARTLPAAFQFSLAAYSYRKLLAGDAPPLTLFDFIDDCAKFGLEGTELTSYYFAEPCTDDYLRQLKRHCFLRGLDISGTAIRCDFGVPQGPRRDREIADVKRWIERAEILGAPVIRIFAGHQHEGQSESETHALIVEGIQACCGHAAKHGIHLALENHGGPTSTAEGLLKIVREIDSDWFGVNLDTGNFHSDHVYDEIAEAAPYAINVQVKVVISGPDQTKQPTDMPRIAEILRQARYRGYVVLEYEEAGDPRVESEVHLKRLREACQA